MYILCVYAIMAPAHESETIVFNFRKLLSTLPNYAELEQILLFSVNWGKQVCIFLWKQFVVVPVTWFFLLSFSGSSLLLCLWLDSSCYLSLEAVCCCACDLIHLVIFLWKQFVVGPVTWFFLLSFSGSSLLLGLWLDSSCYLSLEAVCCWACDLIHLVIILWKQFVVVPVTWFFLFSFSGSSLLCLWLDSSCYLSLEAVCCCACDLIHLVFFLWKQFVVVPVIWFFLLSFFGSSLLLCLWLDSSCYLSLEAVCCCACDLIHLVFFLWKQFVVVPVTWFILLSFSGSSLLCLWFDSSCYLSLEAVCCWACDLIHLVIFLWKQFVVVPVTWFFLFSFSGSSLLLCLWLDSSCYLSLEAVCCCACDLILLVFFLWKQFVVVPVTWFFLFSFSGSSLLCLWLDSSCYLSLEAVCCACDLIHLVIFLWKQFVVVPVTWFILLSFSGSSLLLCLWLDSSCFLSLEAVCCCACDLIHFVIFLWKQFVVVPVTWFILLSFSGSSLLLCLWLDSSCYLSLEAVCCCACDLIHLVIFLWKQFVVVPVTWFFLFSFSGSSLLLFLWLDSSCYLSLEAVCCCACDLILLVFFLWKQFVVVPVTWFILLSFSGSSLLLYLWLDSSCYLSLEAVCCCACDLIHLVIFLWKQFVVVPVTWFILLSFSGSSLLCLWLDSSCYLSLEAVCCCACDLIHLVIFLWKQFVVPVTWFFLFSFSGSSLLLCLWLDSSCYLSLEAVCCCACDLIHLVIFLWKQFVVVPVTWFILLSFSGSSLLLCLWLDSSCYLSLEAVCCCACDLILLVFFLWKQFVVVPVTWFILLSFSGSSLLLCLWLNSSCYLSLEAVCCCVCDLIHLVIFLWKQFVVVPVTWFILLSFSGSSLLLCLWLDSSCYLSLAAVCCCACDLIHLVIFLWKQFVVPVTWFILLSFSGSSLLCLWLDSSCYLSLEAVCCCVCDLIHLVIFPWSYLVGAHVFIYYWVIYQEKHFADCVQDLAFECSFPKSSFLCLGLHSFRVMGLYL